MGNINRDMNNEADNFRKQIRQRRREKLEIEELKSKFRRRLIIIATCIFFVLIVLLVAYKTLKVEVVLKDPLSAELNQKITVQSFIVEVENGSIISEDEYLDTSSEGKKDVYVSIGWLLGTLQYHYTIDVGDTTNPTIDGPGEITLKEGNPIIIDSFFEVNDNSNEIIDKHVEGDFENKEGEYYLTYVVEDKFNNVEKKEFVLKIIRDSNNYSFITKNGHKGEVKEGITYIDGILVVNKTYSLPEDYGEGLTQETIDAFTSMSQDAAVNDLCLYIQSGFRSYWTQSSLYQSYCNKDGQALADTYSARPGHSEHQSGLAFDLNSVDDSFAYTPEGQWVNNNCYKYGFILRYPQTKQGITGYKYEPWHLRFVGKELAEKLYNNGDWITLEEYFGIDSQYQ